MKQLYITAAITLFSVSFFCRVLLAGIRKMKLCSTLTVKCKHAGKLNNQTILQVCCNHCQEALCANRCKNSYRKCGVLMEMEAEAVTPGERTRKPYLQKAVESYNPETGKVVKRYEKIKDGAADVGVTPCTLTKAIKNNKKQQGYIGGLFKWDLL